MSATTFIENLTYCTNCLILFLEYNFINVGTKIFPTVANRVSIEVGIVFAIERIPIFSALTNIFAINKSKPVSNTLLKLLMAFHNPDSVSYTHLDVYKRQTLYGAVGSFAGFTTITLSIL